MNRLIIHFFVIRIRRFLRFMGFSVAVVCFLICMPVFTGFETFYDATTALWVLLGLVSGIITMRHA